MNKVLLIAALTTSLTTGLGEESVSHWRGFDRHHFTCEGRPAFVTRPVISAPGKPWVWRTSFPDFHPEVDLELLRTGHHIAYLDCVDMLGSDGALDLMDRFYDQLIGTWKLSPRPALEGVSRGGLHAYRYAARHPERIACIYADTPVMDLKSWPLNWPESKAQVQDALRHYGLPDEAMLRRFRGNPVDLLEPIARARIPLRHVISLDDRVVPPEQNTLEARRRLLQLGHSMDLVTVEKGTVDSHGHHFPLPQVFASARFISRHTYRLPKKREYFQIRTGLNNCRSRFHEARTGRVAFLGGSITYNPGWRDEVMRYLKLRFPETKFEFLAAGIPSLGSVPHAFRLQRDVLAHGPVDLLFIEAAVNDTTNIPDQPERMLRGMEGTVRQARLANPFIDIVHLHFVMPEHMEDYGKGTVPASVAQHERVAACYGNPSLNLSLEVTERIAAGQFSWDNEFRDLHPSPYGQLVYANSILRLLDVAFEAPLDPRREHAMPEAPLDPLSYGHGRFGALNEAKLSNGFRWVANWTPPLPAGTREGFVDLPALTATSPGAEFEFQFEGTAAGLMIGAGPDTGIIEFTIDDGPAKTLDTFTQWSTGLYLPWAVILDDTLAPGKHLVRVRLTRDHNPRGKATGLHVFQILQN